MKWRFIGGPVKVQNLQPESVARGVRSIRSGASAIKVPGYNGYLDLGVSYQVAKQMTVRLGCNNILDKDPPIIQAFYGTPVLPGSNTYPQTWDWGGRFLFANLTLDF